MKTVPIPKRKLPVVDSAIKDESGIALLMSLGVMSLLIVLSLSFALTTMNSMKSVELSQDIVKARLFDESGFQKVYGLLSSNFADPNDEAGIFPATMPNQTQYIGPKAHAARYNMATFTSSDWGNRAYWYSVGTDVNGDSDTVGIDDAFHVQIAGKNYTPSTAFTSMLTDTDPSNFFGWTHILDSGQDYFQNDTPIIARIAYIIVDESGKIDPWMAVDSVVGEGDELRIGKNVNEINLSSILETNLTDYLERESTIPGKEGLASNTGKWTSLYNIYRTFDENSINLASDSVALIQENLSPFSYDKEAFFDGADDRHRFNLGEGSQSWWDSLPDPKIDSILQPASAFDADNTGGIPWLSIPYNDPAFDDSPVETQVAQVAANLIDYCDTDSLATFNITDSSIPFFCGNEKVPYINEIRIAAQLDAAPPANLEMFVQVELVNMYEIGLGTNGILTVNLDVMDGAAIFPGQSFTSTALSSIPPNSYDSKLIPGPLLTDFTTIGPVAANIAAFTVRINSIQLTDASNNIWDLSFDEPFLLPNTTTLTNAVQSTSVEVNDPRNNLDMDEWIGDKDSDGIIEPAGVPVENSPIWVAGTGAGTMGARNNNFFHETNADNDQRDLEYIDTDLPNAVYPIDADANPWTISTAFIRDGEMQSLWELGAIHRGASWQTINLSTDPVLAIQQVADTGFGNYAGFQGGDANILSQVKLSSDTEVYGRININTYNTEVLKALFYGIFIEDDYTHSLNPPDNEKLGAIGTSQAVPDTLATNTLAVNGTTGGEPFRFRSQIATIAGIGDDSLMAQITTDREKEEVIGKIANLLTVRQNYFSAIITSQIVKDMVTGYKGGTRGKFDDGVDEILAEQRLSAFLYRDALTNKFRAIRYEYLNE